MLELLDT